MIGKSQQVTELENHHLIEQCWFVFVLKFVTIDVPMHVNTFCMAKNVLMTYSELGKSKKARMVDRMKDPTKYIWKQNTHEPARVRDKVGRRIHKWHKDEDKKKAVEWRERCELHFVIKSFACVLVCLVWRSRRPTNNTPPVTVSFKCRFRTKVSA